MSWNYRVMLRNSGVYEIVEAYYDGDYITGWTVDGMGPHGEDFEDIVQDFEYFKKAFDKPVLVEKELEAYVGTHKVSQ